jgi:hypothetical protein
VALVEAVQPGDAVRWHDRRERHDRAARREQRCRPRERPRLEAQDAAQQGAPRERDGQQVHATGKGRASQRLGTGREEASVLGTAARRTTGRLGHRGRGRIDADDQGRGLEGCPSQHGTAITRAEIHDHPVGPGDQAGDLADVHLVDATADDLSHGPQSTLGRCANPSSDRTSACPLRWSRGSRAHQPWPLP